MRFRRFLPMLVIASFSLAACSSMSKVDYEQFHEKALAVKYHEYTSAFVKFHYKVTNWGLYSTLRGKYGSFPTEGEGKVKYSYTDHVWTPTELNCSADWYFVTINHLPFNASDIGEVLNAKYYVGQNFKYVYAVIRDNSVDYKCMCEFDSFGLLTLYKLVLYDTVITKASISYSK